MGSENLGYHRTGHAPRGKGGERGFVRVGGEGARPREGCCAWEHGGTPTVQCRSPGAGAGGWVRCPQEAEEESKREEKRPPTSFLQGVDVANGGRKFPGPWATLRIAR